MEGIKMSEIMIELVDSLGLYKTCLTESVSETTFRDQLMRPNAEMWGYLNAPMVAKTPNGYDVIMAAEMLGIWTPRKSQQQVIESIEHLEKTDIFNDYQGVIELGIEQFKRIGYQLSLEKIVVTILLGDEDNQILMASQGYSGFGGIPGYLLLIVVPNEFNQTRLKSALAHEFNHNVRFTYEPFNHGNVTVEEYLIIEGLAEVFAESLYGSQCRGPWVAEYSEQELREIKAIIKAGRQVKGFAEVAAYMYGDEVAEAQGYLPVGLPRNAGYTLGYHLVKDYLKHSGKTITEATLTTSQEISETSNFWRD